MKKFALLLGGLLLLLPFMAAAQQVLQQNDFASMSGWTTASGSWGVQGNQLKQQDTSAPMARIDHALNQTGVYEISFTVQYAGGGYASQADLANNSLHAGFGLHIAVKNPSLGIKSWGDGTSYLLWLNLDTRASTMTNYPQHYGFRAQVYRSTGDTTMDLVPSLNVDIPAALGITLQDLLNYVQNNNLLFANVPINIQVDTNTGRILVQDPTAPSLWYYFNLPASQLTGDDIAFRTNGMAVNFQNYKVTAQQ
ncbi:MAG TPA: hypothetical protein VMW73_15510 [Spirochaetia bacterium]|nr:hypothetical protein [Spirochaetia bacterium]